MNFNLMVDRTGFDEKPNSWQVTKIQYSLSRTQSPISLSHLANEVISKGMTVRPAVLYGTKKDTFMYSSFIFLDFDENSTTPDDAIRMLYNKFNLVANLYYESFSSTIFKLKFRLVLAFDEPVGSMIMYEKMLKFLTEEIEGVDKVCKDAGRLFFGTNKPCKILNEEKINSTDDFIKKYVLVKKPVLNPDDDMSWVDEAHSQIDEEDRIKEEALLLEAKKKELAEIRKQRRLDKKSVSKKRNQRKRRSIKNSKLETLLANNKNVTLVSEENKKENNTKNIKELVLKFSADKNSKLKLHFKSPIVHNENLNDYQKYFLTMFTSLAYYRMRSSKRELTYNELIAFLMTFGYKNEKSSRMLLNKLIRQSIDFIEVYDKKRFNSIIKLKPKYTYIDKESKYYINNVILNEFKVKNFKQYLILNESSATLSVDFETNKIKNIPTQKCISSKIKLKTQSTVAKVVKSEKTKDNYSRLYYWEVLPTPTTLTTRKQAVTLLNKEIRVNNPNRRYTIYNNYFNNIKNSNTQGNKSNNNSIIEQSNKSNTQSNNNNSLNGEYLILGVIGSSLIPKEVKYNRKFVSFVNQKGQRRNKLLKYSYFSQLSSLENKPTYLKEAIQKSSDNVKLVDDNVQQVIFLELNKGERKIAMENIIISNDIDLYLPVALDEPSPICNDILKTKGKEKENNKEDEIIEDESFEIISKRLDTIEGFKSFYYNHEGIKSSWYNIYREIKQYNREKLLNKEIKISEEQIYNFITKKFNDKETVDFIVLNKKYNIFDRNLLIELLSNEFIYFNQ
jgi:hypothetical protein